LDGIETAKAQGGKVLYGAKAHEGPGNYVTPTIIEISPDAPIVQTEIFAPILYMHRIKDFDSAVEINNNVP
jgi:acyl-CoA reductase-like NAD-dependent aldehyde dehydrogenase